MKRVRFYRATGVMELMLPSMTFWSGIPDWTTDHRTFEEWAAAWSSSNGYEVVANG